jgi:(3,5-dihydroxyphenyl)acetyl-CoA 1,2-dioxygenase
MTVDASVQRWSAEHPATAADPQAAADALSAYVHGGEELLASLPRKSAPARQVHEACRRARMQFMSVHAEWLYARLSTPSRRRSLSDIAFAAARIVPGLVPTREELLQEHALRQAEKEGREIDQGIFFRGLLRARHAGPDLIDQMLLPTARALALLPDFGRDGRVCMATVRIERMGHVAHVTLQNDHNLNAEDNELVEDLETAVDLALLDERVSVGVLRGCEMTHPRWTGKRVFCAGINLQKLAAGQISFVDFLLRRELAVLGKIARGLSPSRVEKPWLAVVESFAIGGGAQMLLVADRVLASDDSYFSLPAAKEGIVPGLANLRLTRMVGARLARRIILAGQQIHATDPDARLVFDEVVPRDSIGEAIERNAALLQGPAVIANRRMLRIAEEPPELFQSYVAEFALEQATRLYSSDVLDKVWRA